MSDRWWSYFDRHLSGEHHWLAGAVNHWQFFQTFYGKLLACVPKGARLLDVGCGPGFSGLYLSALGYRVTGIDQDQRIVELSKMLTNRFEANVNYCQGDAFDLSPFYGKFDLVYSVGVLEHFDRETTIRLLREQALCARQVMICIPTSYTRYADGITDERIYSIKELRRIVREADLEVVTAFGFGDVAVTTFQLWLRRLLPHALYRLFQNYGFAFNIAVIGRNPKFVPETL